MIWSFHDFIDKFHYAETKPTRKNNEITKIRKEKKSQKFVTSSKKNKNKKFEKKIKQSFMFYQLQAHVTNLTYIFT